MQGQDTEGKAKEELKKLCAMVIDAKKFPEKPRDKPTDDLLYAIPWRLEKPKFKPLSRVSDDGLGAIVQAALRLNLPERAEAAVGVVKESLPAALFSEVGKYLAEEGTTAALAPIGHCFVACDLRSAQKPFNALSMLTVKLVTTVLLSFKASALTLSQLFSPATERPILKETRTSLFKEIFNDVIPMIPSKCQPDGQDQQREEKSKRRRFDYHEDRDRCKRQLSEDRMTKMITSEQLSSLFRQCGTIGLHHEAGSLCKVVVEVASSASANTLRTLLLPVLHQLPKLAPSSTECSERYGDLVRTVISSWMQNRIHGKLDVFLENPDETMATFSKVDHIRKHMEKQLRKSACKTWTRKESRPHKLLEEKTVEEREEALKGWRNRCEIAYKAIEEVGFAKLRGILGGEWEDSMEFGLVRSAQDGKSVRRPLGGLAQGKAPSATKSSKVRTREGADVVDLTS
ncbi:MAG: hypothetical protein L6R38_002733 [Xanthoria sp. 2 TBL-2021]|nr:MAG: hypothetical protein L6R38_002733 [Xanthoria sp. 2 TBL-2021]